MMLRGHADDASSVPVTAPRGPESDAVAALLKLGYSQIQAAQAVAGAVREFGAASAETLIRESLRTMGRL